MTCRRRVRIIELRVKREKRETYNPNRIRKGRYSAMSLAGILGHNELTKYKELRVAILGAGKELEEKGLDVHLPAQNPTRHDYDLAIKIYYAHIRPEFEEEL